MRKIPIRLAPSIPANTGVFRAAAVWCFAFLRIHREALAKGQVALHQGGEEWFCIAGLWRPVLRPSAAGSLRVEKIAR